MGFFSWFSPSPLKRLNQELQQKQLQDKQKGRTLSRLRITVNKKDWQPEKAAALMTALFRLQDYTIMTFQIVLYHDSKSNPDIGWYIRSYFDIQELIIRLVYSIYPNANIEVYSGDDRFGKYSESTFSSIAPFFAPFVYVKDCKVDPLTQILGVLGSVKNASTVSLELQMFDAVHDYNAIGEKAIHHNQGNDAVKIIMSAIASGGKMILPPIPKPTNKYDAPYQRQFEDKINSELRVFNYVIRVEDADSRTCQEIVSALSYAFTVFEREPGNRLTTKREYVLILTAQEAAAMWHVPSKEVNAPGMKWLSPMYSSIPEELIGKEEGLRLGANTYRNKYQRVYLVQCNARILVKQARCGKMSA